MGMNDFNHSSGVFNSSIMRFKNDKMHDKLWRKFMDGKHNLLRRFLVTKTISDFIKISGCESCHKFVDTII